MKCVFSLVSVIIVSVGFLFFLFNNPYFVPTNGVGEIEWLNIFVLLFFLFIAVFCAISLAVFGTMTLLRKDLKRRMRIFIASKVALFFSLGLLLVFLLNFFHVLDWIWGISILLVVLVASFVI
ncbi:MAG TPA: hypothetical protein PKI16_01040 [Candidatus Dojkabacteria bacterium]|nr:hypothetical protein [Candidatus Dojkabacteria bacterium]